MPRNNDLGGIRRSQVITTFGPGAIIDFRAGPGGGAAVSVVAAGLEEWDRRAGPGGLANPQKVHEPRLEYQLGVAGFRLPPVAPRGARNPPHLLGVRFPNWLQCPQCSRVAPSLDWQLVDPGDPALRCPQCTAEAGRAVHVAPVRFIVSCPEGHLDEFPWDGWVGHAPDCNRSRRRLYLKNEGTSGLAGLILRCSECKAFRSMEGCFAQDALHHGCRGRSPWLSAADAPHDDRARPRVLQRGASNLYFPATMSALDIPPWSDRLQRELQDVWLQLVRASSDEFRKEVLRNSDKPAQLGMDLESLMALVRTRLGMLQRKGIAWLRMEEYQQFVAPELPDFDGDSEFEVRPEVVPHEARHWIGRVVRATRLREVRALRGFTRIVPPSEQDTSEGTTLAPISVEPKNWLPAIEVRGEGIFLSLNPATLAAWEDRMAAAAALDPGAPGLHARMKAISAAHDADGGGTIAGAPGVSLRLLLLHSLAHALIRQLALECGYSSASLRERLYVSSRDDGGMAGLLIYTATADADGTLGGLSRQGRPDALVRVIDGALKALAWCSSDPLCIEGTSTLSEPTNGAACHACMLAAETSCELFNRFLDRATLIGLPGDPSCGYFAGFSA